MISAVAWRVKTQNPSDFSYRLQVEDITPKNKTKLFKALEGWKQSGVIIDPNENTNDFIFVRAFQSDSEWLSWAAGFPYEISEMSRTGSTRPLKKANKSKKVSITKGGNVRKRTTCSKCGQIGHNARTCGTSKPKSKSKGKRQCGKCGEMGHNRRTCPN